MNNDGSWMFWGFCCIGPLVLFLLGFMAGRLSRQVDPHTLMDAFRRRKELR